MKKLLAALCVFFAAALFLFSCGETALSGRDELASRLRTLGFLSASESEELESELYYAVFNFQKANGIPASGTLDPTTTEAILSDGAVSYGEYLESYSRSAGTDLALGFKDSGKNVRSLQNAQIGRAHV